MTISRPNPEFMRNLDVIAGGRVSIVLYHDGFQEIYVDDHEVGTDTVAIRMAEDLLTAARRVKQRQGTIDRIISV